MECDSVEYLTLKYMDGNISDKEKYNLEVHLANCENCKHQYYELTEVMESIKDNQNDSSSYFFGNGSFENNIMNEVKCSAIPSISLSKFERIICLVFSCVSVFVGICLTLVIFKGDIINFCQNHHELNFLIKFQHLASNFFTESCRLYGVVNNFALDDLFQLKIIIAIIIISIMFFHKLCKK